MSVQHHQVQYNNYLMMMLEPHLKPQIVIQVHLAVPALVPVMTLVTLRLRLHFQLYCSTTLWMRRCLGPFEVVVKKRQLLTHCPSHMLCGLTGFITKDNRSHDNANTSLFKMLHESHYLIMNLIIL